MTPDQELVERLEDELREMALVAAVPMDLWDRFSSRVLQATSRIKELVKRLEIDRAWQMGEDGHLVEVPAPAGFPDGIECRDATIKLLEDCNAALKARVKGLEEALEEIRRLKSEPIGQSGFSTGPALLIRRAQEIARDTLKAHRRASEALHGGG